ncbi:MAG: hypothetical protein IJZ88_04585 [Clostridia bacterium]|nr:hypothetical protein [Clostridia bacterium]
MKKLVVLFFVVVSIFALSACGGVGAGDAKNVKIIPSDSEIYTDEEIADAVDVAIDYFEKEFEGCTLTEITYIGDEKNVGFQEFADRNNAEDVIVLLSSFDVDSSGGDGSLNSNYTYKNWNWILVRNANGQWEHVDHGY